MLYSLESPIIEEQMEATGKGEEFFEAGDNVQTVTISASCMSWNCRGTIMGIGYARHTHAGWCPHKGVLRIWNVFRKEKPKEFELDGCLSSLAFHPVNPLVLVGGTYNGQLFLWDFDKPDPFVSQSDTDEYLHREAITDLIWSVSPFSPPQLYSLSTDGKIIHWDEKLKYPLRGFLIRIRSEFEGGLSMSIVKEDSSTFIIGTESGRVVRCTIPELVNSKVPVDSIKWRPEAEMLWSNSSSSGKHHIKQAAEKYAMDVRVKEVDVRCVLASKPEINKLYSNAVSFTFEKHDGPISGVSCSPFSRNLLASSSRDGSVRIYHMLHSQPLLIWEPSKQITCLSWSPLRPLLLAVGTFSGEVMLYDLLNGTSSPAISLTGEYRTPVSCIKFNAPQKSFLSVGYSNGKVLVYQLSYSLTTPLPDEMRKLNTLLEKAS